MGGPGAIDWTCEILMPSAVDSEEDETVPVILCEKKGGVYEGVRSELEEETAQKSARKLPVEAIAAFLPRHQPHSCADPANSAFPGQASTVLVTVFSELGSSRGVTEYRLVISALL